MKFLLKFSVVAALAMAANVSMAEQKILPTQSSVSFVSKQMGVPVEGSFGKFDAQLVFDPKKPETSKIAFTIDLNSVNIGDANTIAEVKKDGWFQTAKFPSASFTSSAIKAAGAGKFDVAGTLNIKGKTQALTVPIVLTQQAGNTTATGSFTIKRLDFKIGDGDWNDVSLVANEVVVKLKLVMTGINAL
jgi:polyisoprenoid-binding protein YceI